MSDIAPTIDPEEVRELKLRIIGGDFDGHLNDIATALANRAQIGAVVNKWKMKLGDLELTEDDLTFEEVALWSKVAGASWLELRPLTADVSMCRALLLVLIESRLGLTGDEAAEKLKSYRALDVIEAFSSYEVEQSPLEPSESD